MLRSIGPMLEWSVIVCRGNFKDDGRRDADVSPNESLAEIERRLPSRFRGLAPSATSREHIFNFQANWSSGKSTFTLHGLSLDQALALSHLPLSQAYQVRRSDL